MWHDGEFALEAVAAQVRFVAASAPRLREVSLNAPLSASHSVAWRRSLGSCKNSLRRVASPRLKAVARSFLRMRVGLGEDTTPECEALPGGGDAWEQSAPSIFTFSKEAIAE